MNIEPVIVSMRFSWMAKRKRKWNRIRMHRVHNLHISCAQCQPADRTKNHSKAP